MARRKEHTHDQLHTMALDAAREIAGVEGLRGLTARRIATKIGYAPGTLYNVFDNLEDLVTQLNIDTLDSLYEACKAAPTNDDPVVALKSLARAYIQFTNDHPRLWSVLFERNLPHGNALSEQHLAKVRQLLALVEATIAPLFMSGQEEDRLRSARVLWTGLHGICSLSDTGSMTTFETPTTLADTLITNYVAGLRSG